MEELRKKFKPEKILILMVGESPPTNGTFFYKCNSRLFHETKKVFGEIFNTQWRGCDDLLNFFKKKGFYLVDMCSKPVNQLDNAKRRSLLVKGIPMLKSRIQKWQPKVVIPVIQRIINEVNSAVNGMAEVYPALPFPAQGHQPRFRTELAAILRELIKRKIL